MDLYKNKKWLQDKFNTIGYKEDIGKLCNVSGDTIEYWRKKFNIERTIMPSKNKKYICDINFFDNINCESKSYWLGFLMAGGFITESCYIRINSSYMCKQLIKNGIFPKKTGKENIPNTVPYKLLRHFIRGYFDGDGSISKINGSRYYRFGLGSCSELIIKQIKKYIDNLFDCNISYYTSYSYSMPFYYFSCNNSILCNKFFHLLYDNSNIYLERKKELANAMFSICAH